VLAATLKGPGLAPSTRLINDLDDHSSNGVSGQQPHPIFRPELASPQEIPRLIRMRSMVDVGTRVTSEEHADIKRLKQENAELRRASEILKVAGRTPGSADRQVPMPKALRSGPARHRRRSSAAGQSAGPVVGPYGTTWGQYSSMTSRAMYVAKTDTVRFVRAATSVVLPHQGSRRAGQFFPAQDRLRPLLVRPAVLLSRPGARCPGCPESVSPGRSPNPPCASRRNGLSTVAAVRRG
jgi:transposase-like protein